MIVSEKNVSDALTYLAEGGEAPMVAVHLAAKQRRERLFAKLYLATEGAVKERECQVLVNDDYQQAITEENAAQVDLIHGKRRADGADKICEVWRTENANIRAAERVR
jgi:thiamine monophosphate synthase